METCRYVERSALRAGLVSAAQDWPWGSLAERLRFHTRLPLVSTPFLASSAWAEYVNAPRKLAGDLAPPVPFSAKSVENEHVPTSLRPKARRRAANSGAMERRMGRRRAPGPHPC